RNAGRADGMALAQEAAGRIDRLAPANRELAARQPLADQTGLGEAQVLDLLQLRIRRRIVDFDDVDVLGAYARLRVRRLRGKAADVVLVIARIAQRGALQRAGA